MDTLRLDLACALRTWRRQPGTTTAAIVALALGIGANSVVFSFVSAVLLQPLPYSDANRLVMAWQDRSGVGGPAREVISPGLFVDWSRRASVLQGLAAVRGWSPNLTGPDASGNDEPERLIGATVTARYFDTLGISPAYGRTFTDLDDRYGAVTRVVIGYRLWHRRFGDDPAIVGRTIELDGQPTEVIGVMPESFRGPLIDADIWNTMRIDPASAPRGIVLLRAFGRLAPGVSLDQAQAAMSALQTQLAQEDPELQGARARLIRLQDDLAGPARPVLLVLAGSVAMVLLIACANVASLLMAHAVDRRSEMTVRVALGADRWRLVGQLLTETSLLAAVGAGAGLAGASVGVRVLVALAPPGSPRLQDVRLDQTVVAFTAATAALAAIVSGLAPALAASRLALVDHLRGGARGARGFSKARAALVVGEVAAAMTLVVGAGLFVRSLIGLQQVDLGFKPDGLLTASVSPPRGRYGDRDAVNALFDRMIGRTLTLPGVESASMTSVLPLSGMQVEFDFDIVGRPPARTEADRTVAAFRSVHWNFFDTMGMRVVAGRGFAANDRAGAPMVVVANLALVRRYWNGVPPLGARVVINGKEATIVGVVADVHHTGPAATPDGEMYVPHVQLPASQGWLVVRTTGDPATLAGPLRQAMREVDPNLPLARLRPMSALVDDSVAETRFLATVLSWFSGIAAALALMGVYGLLVFSVSRRVREIAVRMALGASRSSVVWLVLRQSLGVVGSGVVLGAAAAVGLSRLIQSLLFGIGPGDPATVATMSAFVIAAAAVASVLPARRAAGIDPAVALRNE